LDSPANIVLIFASAEPTLIMTVDP